MKARIQIAASAGLILIALIYGAAIAGNVPNFSGVWVLDSSRSISAPAGLRQTMTVLHKGDQITVEHKLANSQGERTFSETYTLDGKEAEFTPQGMTGPAPGKGKRKAYWLPDKRGVVVSDETTTDGPKGPVVNQQMRKWILSSDGRTLTIDYYFDGPRGSFEAKRVYDKQ